MRVGIISDTHNLVRPEALDALRGVEHIVHAGDICRRDVLDALASLTVVRGNNDVDETVAFLPEHARVQLGGATIHIVMISPMSRRRSMASMSSSPVIRTSRSSNDGTACCT